MASLTLADSSLPSSLSLPFLPYLSVSLRSNNPTLSIGITNMHPCLHVDDIRVDICRAVALDLQLGRRSLFVLARTCRLFRDPALDVLWARLESPEHLYMLFPPDMIRIGDGDETNDYVVSLHTYYCVPSRSSRQFLC